MRSSSADGGASRHRLLIAATRTKLKTARDSEAHQSDNNNKDGVGQRLLEPQLKNRIILLSTRRRGRIKNDGGGGEGG